MVGARPGSDRARPRRSAGVPWASTCPASRITTRSQYSASSMKWVVTVIVTTHFMEEAEYCDRVVILDAGQVLAQGTPADLRGRARSEPGRAPTMEDAFIAIVEEARQGEPDQVVTTGGAV